MELHDLINENLDPDELVDVLGLSTEELTELLWDQIYENRSRFAYLELDDEGCFDGSND